MAKKKQELLDEATKLGLTIDPKTTVNDIKQALDVHKNGNNDNNQASEPETGDEVPQTASSSATAVNHVAKSGKRSAKALKEKEELLEKAERKAAGITTSEQPVKKALPATRSKLERRGKHFRKSAELLTATKVYSTSQAAELAKKTSHVKFDASVELHANLGVDPRQADQNIRDALVLPAGSGKKVIVAVLTNDAAEARTAGADIAGSDDLLASIEKGNIEFDILITTPTLMPKLGKYARLLGPRGLMPNPKSGTVTTDVNKAIAEAKAGRVEYRVDSSGIVHLAIGKASFTAKQLQDNLEAVLTSIKSNKPNNVKGTYLKTAYLSTTMGPSIKLDLSNYN